MSYVHHRFRALAKEPTIKYVGGSMAALENNGIDRSISLTALTGGIGSQAIENDLVIVAWSCGKNYDLDMAMVTSGYTEVCDLYANSSNDTNLGVFYKFMTATPDTTATIDSSITGVNAGLAYGCMVFRGVNTTTPMDATATTALGTSSSSAANPPSITPVTAGAAVIGVGAGSWRSAYTSTDLIPFISAGTTSTFFNTQLGAGSFVRRWVSGAVNPAAFSGGSLSAGMTWAACTMALRPA